MNILITGYKGFIGRNLFAYLQTKGHTVEGYDYIENSFPDPSKYDWIIHLGAISKTTETNVNKIMKQNYDFSMRLLQLCDTMGTNFQYASSASVYGTTGNFNEEGPVYPMNAYAWSKYFFDRFVESVDKDGFQILVQGFRYFNVYGPHEEDKKDQASPITKFTKQAKENKVIKIFENSENYMRDFVCVSDICKVHEQMLTTDTSGIFNVGTGKSTSFLRIAKIIAEKYNAKLETIPMPANLSKQYKSYTCADLTKLNKHIDINWKTVKEFIDDQ